MIVGADLDFLTVPEAIEALDDDHIVAAEAVPDFNAVAVLQTFLYVYFSGAAFLVDDVDISTPGIMVYRMCRYNQLFAGTCFEVDARQLSGAYTDRRGLEFDFNRTLAGGGIDGRVNTFDPAPVP